MSFDMRWIEHLDRLLRYGIEASPRGRRTRELPSATLEVDMRRPVLTVKARKLNYKFMAAEAHWILTGDDRVATIAPYNKRIAAFSDDGERFFGAYGPKVAAQLGYVVAKLSADRDSRQAGLTLWRECPPETKDVPCTVAMFFSLRAGFLNCHTFMRSNDVWLGTPYDVFNFSMLAHLVCARLGGVDASPGALYLTAASSHLYEENWEAARAMTRTAVVDSIVDQPKTPAALHSSEGALLDRLRDLRETRPGDPLRWWEGGR